MRALVLEDWWKLEVRDVPDPEVRGQDVLLRVIAAGICGSDIHGYTGENGRRQPGQIMGHEMVGEIIEIGVDVPESRSLAIGDVVTVNPVYACGQCERCAAGLEQSCAEKSVLGVTTTIQSAFAELMSAPAQNVVPLAPGFPAELGALIEPLAVGYHAVSRGAASARDNVLVIGGGPIGQACVLAARRAGVASIVVSEFNPERNSLLTSIGATTILNPTSERALPQVLREMPVPAPDVVLDAVGTTQSLSDALSVVELGGRVVLVGMGSPTLDLPAYDISTMERSIVGSFCYSAAEFHRTVDWAASDPALLEPLVEGRVGFDSANDAFHDLARGRSAASKILILPAADH